MSPGILLVLPQVQITEPCPRRLRRAGAVAALHPPHPRPGPVWSVLGVRHVRGLQRQAPHYDGRSQPNAEDRSRRRQLKTVSSAAFCVQRRSAFRMLRSVFGILRSAFSCVRV
eukprot:gene8319-biopygen10997